MKQFHVIRSELPTGGRGVNGRTLFKFLQAYVGRRGVGTCSLQQLLDGAGVEAEYVFLGLPAPITARHLGKLRYRHLILYDLADAPGLQWDERNEDLLRGETASYFRAWHDDRWQFGMQMGVLPVRRYAKVRVALELGRLARGLGRPAPEPRFDVMFLGTATGTRRGGTAERAVANERVEWLLELTRHDAPYALWGGLTNRVLPGDLVEAYGDLSALRRIGKVSFWTYFHALQRSRVALTPQGHAPWSYRHYEATYARAVVVTSDFRPIRTLVPLPKATMIHVERGQSVLPAVEAALALRRERPDVLDANIRFLERFLDRGMYSRRRPELYERFLSQLPTSAAGTRLPPDPQPT